MTDIAWNDSTPDTKYRLGSQFDNEAAAFREPIS